MNENAARGYSRIAIDFPVEITFEEQAHSARGLSLSTREMFLKSRTIVLEGETIELMFHLPGYSRRFRLPARVATSKLVRTGNGSVFCAFAVLFMECSVVIRKILEAYIRRELDGESVSDEFEILNTPVFGDVAI